MMYGIDVGGTKIEIALFDDENGAERKKSWRVETPKTDYQLFLTTIKDMVAQADQIGQSSGSVGIGLPGFINPAGRAVSSNIPCINNQPLAKDISSMLGRPVGFENDVKTFVLSESNGGAADGVANVLGIVLGTGVAGGLCIDGKLYYGKQKIAGEYGHMSFPAIVQQRYNFPIRICGCGGTACVEPYLSGPGLLWMSGHFGATYTSVQELIEALRNARPDAETIFSAYIDCLACYFSSLTVAFDPDVIVIGGGLTNVDEIFQRLPDAIDDYLIKGATPPKIVKPKFGDSSGVRGAALIGYETMQAAAS